MGRHLKALVVTCALLALAITMGVGIAAATAPTVSIDAPSSVSYTSAHVSGKVNPQDGDSYYYFQYSANPSAEGWTSGTFQGPLSGGSGETPVSDDLSGLKPGTHYFVRLVANNFVDPEVVSAQVSLTTDPVAPPAISLEAPTAVTGSTAHFSGTVNPEAPEAAPTSPAVEAGFAVDWHFECTPACPGLEGTVAADNSGHLVESDATGLQPGTEYEVTLVGENAGGSASAGPATFTTDPVAPQITSVTVAPLSSEATIAFKLNPGGTQTSYLVQYGPTSTLGSASAAKIVPAGAGPVSASVSLVGLSVGATYYFKVVATNSVDSVASSTSTFTTTGGELMCPCWNYEQVSPQQKTHSDVSLQSSSIVAAEDGSRVSYTSTGGIGDPSGLPSLGQSLSIHMPSGWSTRSLNPYQSPNPAQVFNVAGFIAFSPNLTQGVYSAFDPPLTPDAEGKVNSLYLSEIGPESDTYALLTKSAEPLPPAPFATPEKALAAVSDDWASFAFQSLRPLTPDAPPSEEQFKVYLSRDGHVELVSILPDGSVPDAGAFAGSGAGGSDYIGAAMSGDGSRVVFTANPDPQTGTGQIYVRVNGTETIHVSGSQRSTPDPEGTQPALFWDFSPEGRYVFFTSSEKLTDDATAGLNAADLYRHDLVSGQLEDLTTSDPGGAQVEGVLGTAAGGSVVYFVARTDQAPGGQLGRRNIYRWAEGEGTSYVGRLNDSGEDSNNWSRVARQGLQRSSRVSPDGNFLAFTSEVDQVSGASGPTQIYLYEAGGQTVCVSCGDRSPIDVEPARFDVSASGLVRTQGYLPRNLSGEGVVFFNTAEPLAGHDTNGQTDVYAYRDGRAELVSDGRSAYGAYFADADIDGANVFIVSRNRLRATDTDENVDLYVATLGAQAERDIPPPPRIPCSGEACQPPPFPSPLATGPQLGSSATGDAPKVQKKRARKRKPCGKHQRGKRGAKCKRGSSKKKGGK